MMKKIILILFIIPFTLFANIERKRDQIIRIVKQELQEVIRIVNQTKGRNADFVIRMSELHFELAKHLRDKENSKYLALSIKRRQKINRSTFFAKSNKSFKSAQKSARFFLKRYPHHPAKGEVYYILAKNAQAFQKGKSANKYFKLANKTSKGNVELEKKSSISLAENKFNKKQYRQAIPLYEKALRGKRDRWYTKDAFNLAWCYFRIKNYSKAISLMKQVHKLSGKGNHINMRPFVERDLAYFYVKYRKVSDAIAFYKKIGANLPDKLIAVATYLEKEEKYADAEKVLKEVLKYKPTNKQKETVYIKLLKLYEKYIKYSSHLKACQRLFVLEKNRALSDEGEETLLFQLKRVSGILQQQVASKINVKRPKVRRQKGLMAVKYFKMLIQLGPEQKASWSFFTAETYYAIGDYQKAIPYYDDASKWAMDKRDKKVADRSINGILAALGKPKVSKAIKNKYTLPAFNYYLENYPKSKKSFSIYQRAFNLHFKKRQMGKAENILGTFSKNFPKARGKQEAMIAKIIDYYKKRKNYDEVERWTEKVTSGEFNVSDKYTKKVRVSYVSTKLEKVQRAEGKGAKKEALEGYMEIYHNKLANRSARVNAGYNIATIFYEMGDVQRSYIWANKSLGMMSVKEKLKFSGSFLAIGNDYLNRREFSKSVSIYKKLLKGLCRTKSKYRKELYKNIYTIELAQKMFGTARSSVESLRKCGIGGRTVNNARYDVVTEMSRNKRWREFNSYLILLQKIPSLRPKLIEPLDTLRAHYISSGLMKQANSIKAKILYFYKKSPKKKLPAGALDIVANFQMTNLTREAIRLAGITLRFPEKIFSQTMQRKFKALERIKKKAAAISSIGSPKTTIRARRILAESHKDFGDEVKNFTPPKKNKKYIALFKKDMRSITTTLKKESAKQMRLGKNEIIRNNIFSRDNNFFLSKKSMVEYFYPSGAMLMDRGGGK
ncbi:MAG: hypothetical protein DRQ88_07615 [Epsilonproteobacteria bacterium]|nr:MAG: hypothetical protein DRQ89_03330 [Campylobacterota bacterium]RLA66191.1 MAG: hypothetical protein DRQ88_07615 [Campylobacterota bacterium]